MEISNRFRNSQVFLDRALRFIPLGSQTFSKSISQYPKDCSPLFIQKAKKAFVWDIDKNRYVDTVNALAAITLGYRNRAVDRAVKKQVRRGSIYSLPGKLETIVAEKIHAIVPGAEKMRFAKNGSDATSAAIRLSRAYTSRDHIIVCGYHGWQDWYIGTTTRNRGVPSLVANLSHRAVFNDLESFKSIFEEYPDQIAAVIIEPLGAQHPNPGFLSSLKSLCHTQGALLVFDETITGFRVAEDGAQGLFGVTPDLSTFGKGIANGYPLSVVAGRGEVMDLMEEIFFSGTFGGDLIALAAANEVLDMHVSKEVCPVLTKIGDSLRLEIEDMLSVRSLNSVLSLSGHSSWLFWNWNLPTELINLAKSSFLQNNIENGVLMLNTINVSTELKGEALNVLLKGLSKTLDLIADSHVDGDYSRHLKGVVIEPLFKVR